MLICSSSGFNMLVSTLEKHSSSEFGKSIEDISKLLDPKEAHGDYPAATFQNLPQTVHFTGYLDKVMKDCSRSLCDTPRVGQLAVIQAELRAESPFNAVSRNCVLMISSILSFCDAVSHYYICLEGLNIGNLMFLNARQFIKNWESELICYDGM